jgi:hypothetical protein
METGRDYGAWPAHKAHTWPAQLRVQGTSEKKIDWQEGPSCHPPYNAKGYGVSSVVRLKDDRTVGSRLPGLNSGRGERGGLGEGGASGAHRRWSSATARVQGGGGRTSQPPRPTMAGKGGREQRRSSWPGAHRRRAWARTSGRGTVRGCLGERVE